MSIMPENSNIGKKRKKVPTFSGFQNFGGRGGLGIEHLAFQSLNNHPRQDMTNL